MLPIINYIYTTKTSCFNHRVVTLVAVKLKGIGYERFTLVAQTMQLHKVGNKDYSSR